MLRRVALILVVVCLWARPSLAQTEKYKNNPSGGAQSTLAVTITSGATSIQVVSAALFPTAGTFTILIETEYIICTSVSGTTFTCPTRGSEGSSAAGHTSGVNVYHVVTDRSMRNNPLAMTTAGDLAYLNNSSAQARLGIGATGDVLGVASGLPAWTTTVDSLRFIDGAITGTGLLTEMFSTNFAAAFQADGSVAFQDVRLSVGANAVAARSDWAKSRTTDGTTHAIVVSGDDLGRLVFRGDDGAVLVPAAEIHVEVDGTPGTSDMPGRIVFLTTPVGSATPVERFRISQNGLVTVAGGISLGTTMTFTDNVRQTFNPGSTVAGFNVGSVATDPSTPINGDIWYDSALDVFVVRAGGANVTLGAGPSSAATYITQTAEGSLSAEQALSALSTGIMRVETTTGVLTSLTTSAGIFANISDETGTGALVGANSPAFVNYFQMTEMTAPAAGAANTGRFFVEDNGSGKSRACVIFTSGAAQCFATEP